MPLLNEKTILPHLETVIRGKRHWLFLTDNDHGQTWLTGFLVALSLSIPEPDVGYGVFGWIDSTTGISSPASFVTCSKDCPPPARAAIRALLSGVGVDPDADQDIVLLSQTKRRLGLLVQSIADGSFKILPPVGNN